MQHWDLRSLPVEPHEPLVLHSSRGEARTVVLHLPAGEALKDHQVHERAHLVVIDPAERHEVRARSDARLLLVLAPWPGQGHPGTRDA